MTHLAPRFLLSMLLLSAAACGSSSSSSSDTADAAPEEDASPLTDAGDGGHVGDAATQDAAPRDSAADVNALDAYVPPDSSGGGCTYTTISGTATIVSVEPAGSNESSCTNDGQHVAFTFAPAGTAADAGSATQHLFTIGSGEDPPNACLGPLGITLGAQIPATEQMIASGTCDPFIFALTVDSSTCTTECDQ